MSYNGVIFDFNGTLFWDTPLHNKAWNIFLKEYDIQLSDEEFFSTIHGKNNRDLFFQLFGNSITDEDIRRFTAQKEGLYQQLCLKTDLLLAPGATDFFDFLTDKGIPFTIATASGKENVDFYFEHLGIDKWFAPDRIVYNDGTIKGKPDPEIYLKAMALIDRKPDDVIVFEDAVAGLQSARNAGAGRIIVVNSNNDDYSQWADCQIITNYNQVDHNLFF